MRGCLPQAKNLNKDFIILTSTMNYRRDLVIKAIWYLGFKTVVMENLLTRQMPAAGEKF